MKMFKRFLAVLVCLATALTVTACGGSSSSSDTFTFSSTLAIATFDSTLSDDGMSFNAMHACIDGLMQQNAKGEVAKAIAKSYTTSDDGLTWTFKLRDAKWSNGDKVTANDFVYAWKRIIKNAGNYAYMMGSEGAGIKGADELLEKTDLTDADMDTLGVTAVNDSTLKVELSQTCPYFLELMTFPCYFPINEKFAEKQGDQYGKKASAVLSNGAYKLSSWDLGSKATYTKNNDYWNADNVKLKKLVLQQVGDVKSGVAAFESGKVQFAELSSALVDKYKSKDYYKAYNEGFLYYLELNFGTQALANANIRKALSYSINRADIAKNVLKDGSKAATGFVPSQLAYDPADSSKDYRDEAGSYTEYSKSKAQEYFDAGLKELGVSEVTLRLTYGTDEAPMDSVATYLQSSFSAIKGLNITMVATTKKDRLYTKEANGDFDIALTRWGPDYSDPTTYLNLMITGNANNYGNYTNAAYDAKMKAVQSETDTSKRWQDMIDAEKIGMDDYAKIPLIEKGASVIQKSSIKNLVHRPVGVPYTFNFVSIK